MIAPKVSLDQWSVFISVVESGSYASAAKRLHKSQSTLTYGVQRLEELLGVKAFEKRGRRSVLTPTGEVLYRRGKMLVQEAARLEQGMQVLAQGWEPEIRIAVEVIFPTWLLLECLARFAAERRATRLELLASVLGGTDEALTERKVELAIASSVPPGFVGDPLTTVRFVCAAAPDHPLHSLGRPLNMEDLYYHRHLVIRDSGVQRERAGGWVNEIRWTVSHKATSIRAAISGLGFSWYPEESIREELAQGALKQLPLKEGVERYTMLYLVFADPDTAGPGTRRLAEIIREKVGSISGELDRPPPQHPAQ